MDYDRQYESVDALFGAEPEQVLVEHAGLLPAGGSVLDVGAGQGRNALYLARGGFSVDALEPSRQGLQAIERAASAERLPVRCHRCGFEGFTARVGYHGILVFGLFPDLDRDGIDRLRDGLRSWSSTGTLLWLTGFTVEDPAFPVHSTIWERIGEHSFRSPEGRVRTYLDRGEILTLFPDHAVVHHREGPGPEHRHGDGPPERHGLFEAVLRSG